MTKLPRGRAPNYRLKKDYKDLPQGTFVSPVRVYYLPKHIKDSLGYYFDEKREAPCFTSVGFMTIPWEIIEET